MIKMVISDMDGTLIGRDEILPESVIHMAKKLKKKGILFTLATGRVECMADAYVKKLGIDIPYIACNGVTIVKGKEILQRHKIPLKGLRPLIHKADSMNMSLVYSIDGVESVYRITPWIVGQQQKFDRYHKEHRFTEEEWETLYIDKLMIMDDVRDGSIGIMEDMCRELAEDYGFTRYTNKSVEVVNKQSTKASALRELAKLLKVDMKEVMAIGDHQNDIEMITEAGIGAAVGNATEDLKAAADYVAAGEQEQGVMEAVEKFCGVSLSREAL